MHSIKKIRIATRQSKLALWQTNFIKRQLQQINPDLEVELVGLTTAADKNTQVALNAIGGKELFVKELQQAILDGRADCAVHSIKDLSALPHPELTLAAICKREDPRDVLVAKDFAHLADLPIGARVGTASPRRQCFLLNKRPDLKIELLRGNVETRIQKSLGGDYDAIILAAAGLIRLGLTEYIREYLPVNEFIPAIGQGAIGIECAQNNGELLNLLAPLNHVETALCVHTERAFNAELGGDCFTPLAAHASLSQNTLLLSAMIGELDGQLVRSDLRIAAELAAATQAATQLAIHLQQLINKN